MVLLSTPIEQHDGKSPKCLSVALWIIQFISKNTTSQRNGWSNQTLFFSINIITSYLHLTCSPLKTVFTSLPSRCSACEVWGHSALCLGFRPDVHLLRLLPGQNRLLDSEPALARHAQGWAGELCGWWMGIAVVSHGYPLHHEKKYIYI